MSTHIINERSAQTVVDLVARMPRDGTMEVEVRRKTDPRSREQNRYLHLLCRRISGEKGVSIDKVKTWAVMKFVGPLEWLTIAGQEVPVLPSTTSLDKGAMSELIEHLEAWAVEQGIDI